MNLSINTITNTNFPVRTTNKKNVSFRGNPEKLYMEKMNFKTRGLYNDAKPLLELKAQEFHQGLSKILDDFNADKFCKVSGLFEPVIGIHTYALGCVHKFLRIPQKEAPVYALNIKEDNEPDRQIFFDNNSLKAQFDSKELGISLNELTSASLETILSDNKLLNAEERLKTMLKNERQKIEKVDEEINKILTTMNMLTEKIKNYDGESEKHSEEITKLSREFEAQVSVLAKLKSDSRNLNGSASALWDAISILSESQASRGCWH